MRQFKIAAILASLISPAMAQVTQQPSLQSQVDAVTGQINREIQSMGTLIIGQKARIDDLEAQVAKFTAAATSAAPPPSIPHGIQSPASDPDKK